MIRIVKNRGPAILVKSGHRGPRATERVKAAWDAGDREFEFDSGIYAAKSVKQELIAIQHGKCCFCESKITHVDYGDVEHFRPKAGFVQKDVDPLERPGYYWLAYDWSNLFLSCALCNQLHKKNLFPLLDPSQRARSHHNDVRLERPMLVHPEEDDPEDFIGFRDEHPYGRDDLGRGRATIEALGLDRPELDEQRRTRLSDARRTKHAVSVLRQLRERYGTLEPDEEVLLDELEAALQEYQHASVEYRAMLKAAGIAA